MQSKLVFLKYTLALLAMGAMKIGFSQEAVIDTAAIYQEGLTTAQVALSLTELTEQTAQLATELKALDPNNYQWSNAQNLINELGTIVNQKDSLAYSADNIGTKFTQMFPGYVPPEDFSSMYKSNTNSTLNTLNGSLQSLGSSAKDFESENSRLAFLQTQAQNSKGQLQAIQASAQISSEVVSQLQLLRQTVTTQANAETAYHANKLQSEASAKAKLDSVINAGSTEIMPYGTSGDTINVHGT